MSLIQRSEDAKALWCAIVDHTPPPEDRQFVLWARRFTEAQIERALLKVDKKFASKRINPEIVWRYTTGLLLNLEREDAGLITTVWCIQEREEPQLMTESAEITSTTEQLLEALRTLESSATRDLGIYLLEAGQVHADSTLAELSEAVKAYYTLPTSSPQQQALSGARPPVPA